MSQIFEPRTVARVARNPLVTLAAALPLLLAAWIGLGRAPQMTLTWLLVGIATSLWAFRRKPWPRLTSIRVGADRSGLHLGDERIASEQIRTALVIPGEGRKEARVRIEGDGPGLPVELAVGTVGEARRLVRALGRDATRSTATFRVGSGAMGNVRRLLVAGAAVVGSALGASAVASLMGAVIALTFAPFVGMLAFVVLLNLPSRLVVGADGFSLRWLFFRRFVSYAEVECVTRFARPREQGLFVLLRSGESLPIPMETSAWETATTGTVEERLEEAIASFRRGGTASVEASLERGDRAASAWVTALRALGAGANAGPREAPVPRDRLWQIVEDPRADHGTRAAAAVALGGGREDEERERLRAVAGATAAPKLRVAIEAAAGEEQAAIEEALAALEQERAARRA